eukprot:7382125-Prymnesium_polylepis.1
MLDGAMTAYMIDQGGQTRRRGRGLPAARHARASSDRPCSVATRTRCWGCLLYTSDAADDM